MLMIELDLKQKVMIIFKLQYLLYYITRILSLPTVINYSMSDALTNMKEVILLNQKK